MIWNRLKDNACPKCRSLLTNSILDDEYRCSSTDCDFRISSKRFDEIITDMYKPRSQRRDETGEDNLAMLNNFGHKVRSEDYSDKL